MKTVTQIIEKTMTKTQPLSEQPPIPVGMISEFENATPNEAVVNVNKVFTTLRISFPAWYDKYFSNEKAEQLGKRVWRTGIKNLTSEQVDAGLQSIVLNLKFPPTLSEFIQICKRIDGLPDLDQAFDQALTGNYNSSKVHEVVKAAANKTGVFDLRRGVPTDQALKKRFAYNYQIVSERYAQGLPLDDPIPKALEHQDQNTSKGVFDEFIDQQVQALKQSGKSGYEAFKALGKASA